MTRGIALSPAYGKERRPRSVSACIRHLMMIVLVLVLSVLSLAPSVFSAKKPVVIRVWDHHVHDKKFRQQAFKQFNKENPDIKVEYTSQVGGSLQTVLEAAFRVQDPPDIFVPYVTGGLVKLIELGWVMPLDDLAPNREEFRKWLATFPQGQDPFAEGANMFGGKIYSWPISGQAGRIMLFWNTRLFKNAGLKKSGGESLEPETWADVRTYAKKLTELGRGSAYGIVHGIINPGVWDMDVFASIAPFAGWPGGGGYAPGFDFRTGLYDFHHPGLRGAIQLWLDMKKDGSIFPGDLSMDDELAKARFAQERAGMIFGGPWVPGGLVAMNPKLDFDTVLPPTEKRGVRQAYVPAAPLAGSSEYVVSSKVENRDAVWRVIKFMTSAYYQGNWVKAGGGISVFPEYNKPEYFAHPTLFKIAEMGVTGRRSIPQVSAGAFKVWDLMDPVFLVPGRDAIIQGQWIGKLSWEAWDDYEQRLNKALDKAIVEARKLGFSVTRADFTFPDWDPTKDYVTRKDGK